MKLIKRKKPTAFSFRPYSLDLENWINRRVKQRAAAGYGDNKNNFLNEVLLQRMEEEQKND